MGFHSDTSLYRSAHGVEPKGFGLWYFTIMGITNSNCRTVGEHWARGNLKDARRQAVRDFKAACGERVQVLEVVIQP